jgi:hypothetical protein
MTPARDAFAKLWRDLAGALVGEPAPGFPAATFTYGLLPRPAAPDSPYLCWEDGMALAARSAEPEAIARSIAACAQALAAELAIAPPLAGAFAAVCGFAAIGRTAFPEWQLPCDIAAAELAAQPGWRPGSALSVVSDSGAAAFWRALKPSLCATSELFAAWSLPDSAYPALRTAWHRGRSIELNRG